MTIINVLIYQFEKNFDYLSRLLQIAVNIILVLINDLTNN